MRVLHVNNADLVGRRFSGFDLLTDHASRGVHSTQAVLIKLSASPDVVSLVERPADDAFSSALHQVELQHGMNNILYPWGRRLCELEEFESADLVHYHLIHNRMISLLDLPDLTRRKPSVWTFHDPWPLTGHCIQPMDCEGWLSGCQPCPHLDWHFSVAVDRAGSMWRVKEHVYPQLDIDVVVASRFMVDMMARSPLGRLIERVHMIPFGVRAEYFLSDDEQENSRRRLGIPRDHYVLFFRAESWEVKGLDKLIDALDMHPPSRPTTLLAVGTRGLLGRLKRHYNIVELGWVNDEELYPRLFSASDVFVMPSLAESFGLMALESMAAGRPVISFEGTPLPEITGAPECGIAVARGDSRALRAAIDSLADDPEQRRDRGARARSLAQTEFSLDRYLDRLARLYEDVLNRRRGLRIPDSR